MPHDEPAPAEGADLFEKMATAYVAFLQGFPWGVPLAEKGGREGLNKFIKNAQLWHFRGNKYAKTPLITADALPRLRRKPAKGLIFEHVVPIVLLQRPSEVRARAGTLTREFVLDWLQRYWVTATITTEENSRLIKDKMPAGWDGNDAYARYRQAGIALMPNPDAVPGLPPIPLSTPLP